MPSISPDDLQIKAIADSNSSSGTAATASQDPVVAQSTAVNQTSSNQTNQSAAANPATSNPIGQSSIANTQSVQISSNQTQVDPSSSNNQSASLSLNLNDGTLSGGPVPPSAQNPVNSPLTPVVPSKPVNQRAFNLDADTDESTVSSKPEKYAIPKMVSDKYPDLVNLIKTTESMDDEEREYWFQILPVMTAEQIEKFSGILQTEKQQLTDLDKEYEDELSRLNEKHLLEWKEFESKEKNQAIKTAEAASSVEEKQMEEDLLAKLSDV